MRQRTLGNSTLDVSAIGNDKATLLGVVTQVLPSVGYPRSGPF